MSRILSFCLTVVLALGIVPSVLGQQVFFDTKEACVSALKGEHSYYSPTDITRLGAWQEAVRYKAAEPVQYGEDVCVFGHTAMGKKIYIAPAHTLFFSIDGISPSADGRCGNSVIEVFTDRGPSVTQTRPNTSEVVSKPRERPTATQQFQMIQPEPGARLFIPVPVNEPAQVTTNVVENVEYPVPLPVEPYIPKPFGTATVVSVSTTTSSHEEKSERDHDGRWCQTYRPGAKTLYVFGHVAKAYGCHPKAMIVASLGVTSGIFGGAALTSSLMFANAAASTPNINGGKNIYPPGIWENGPCSLWERNAVTGVKGPYFGWFPKPARCF